MENLELEVQKRNKQELKKNGSGRLRKQGFIPAIIYGLNSEPLCIKVYAKKFKDLLKGRTTSGLVLNMRIDENGNKKNENVILKEFQRDLISRSFIHLDFMRIEMEKEVDTTVPVVIINDEEAVGVREEGGVIQHGLRELDISCLPKDIPEKVEFDALNLKLGDVVKVSDIEIGENVKILNHPEEVVVSIIHPTQLREEEVVEEEAVEEEPELITKEKEKEEEEKPESKKTPKESD